MILTVALLLASVAAVSPAKTFPFEISSNKPFVAVTIDRSPPQWFILDSGNRGATIIARECADRLKLEHGPEQRIEAGAGSGTPVVLATSIRPLLLGALGETLTVAEPPFLNFGHVSAVEGRRLDGSLGNDFLSRHVIEIDYERRQITIRDPDGFTPPPSATVVPVDLESGWAIAEGTITTRGGSPIRCRLIVDTGVRFSIALFRPFSDRHHLYDVPGNLRAVVVGAGVGGLSRGDVGRLEELTVGPVAFPGCIAAFSRDSSGIFAMDGPDGIIGGELLRRYRTTFDYPHGRLLLESYGESPSFEYDMSGLFLAADAPDFAKLRIVSVNAETPAAEAGLRPGDEIVSIDGRQGPALTLEAARALLRAPVTRQLQIRRSGQIQRVSLKARRLI